MKVMSRGLMVLAMGLLFAWPAAAQESLWRSTVVVYGWATRLDGSFKLGDRDRQASVNIADVIGHLEIGTMGRYRGETDRWSVVGDIIWASFGATRDAPLTRTKADLDLLVANGSVGYKLGPNAEVFAGIRYVKTKSEADIRGPLGNRELHLEGDNSMWDPIIGARGVHHFSERWLLQGEIDAGGGANMNFTTQAMANVGYKPNDLVGIWGGMRALYLDFDEAGSHNRQNAAVTVWGPQAGVSFTF